MTDVASSRMKINYTMNRRSQGKYDKLYFSLFVAGQFLNSLCCRLFPYTKVVYSVPLNLSTINIYYYFSDVYKYIAYFGGVMFRVKWQPSLNYIALKCFI